MTEWQRDASAVGFQVDTIASVAEFVAGGVVAVDGPPVEAFPDYWVIPGFLPYDGLVILAVLDRRPPGMEPTRFRPGAPCGCPRTAKGPGASAGRSAQGA